ncbi:GIY-YIG nuclease family protein [Streptomyces sp. NPDC090052]|uniref:GIY-YIG nuclease family protein n=1 Tax=Streptomyces sp. NPDC090052 TaxID=3365931 RepID=UPI0038032067
MSVVPRTVAAVTSSTPGDDSSVYVIGSAGSTRVKIGTSVSPEKRLKELQTGNPDRPEVLWYTAGGRELEALLHRALQPCPGTTLLERGHARLAPSHRPTRSDGRAALPQQLSRCARPPRPLSRIWPRS